MIAMYLAMERELLVVQQQNSTWQIEPHLVGMQPVCLAIDPLLPQRVYCGTFGRGLWRSEDAGRTWKPIGDLGVAMEPNEGSGITSAVVTAVAVSATERANGYGVVYAGTEPTALFRSEDGGDSWRELPTLQALPSSSTWSFPPRPYTSHVRWITPDPLVSGRVFVAIEAGALVRSLDGGEHWEDRKPDGPFDTHTLLMHRLVPDRLYSAAGDGMRFPGRGYNESEDAGDTWYHPDEGLQHHYLWGMSIDPADPETVLVSAASDAYKAHHERSNAYMVIYRKTASQTWHEVMEGLPDSQGLVAPVLASNPDEAHTFYVLTNKGLYRSDDAGSSWEQLAVPWREEYLMQHQQALAVQTL
jgi:photosystem II stability/assembly factor-like uncharacterized protein